jgi:hypothetical protein
MCVPLPLLLLLLQPQSGCCGDRLCPCSQGCWAKHQHHYPNCLVQLSFLVYVIAAAASIGLL